MTHFPTIPIEVTLPRIEDPRGNLTFIQDSDQVPFDIERVDWIYDVPGGVFRPGHILVDKPMLVTALSGSLDVTAIGAFGKACFTLNRPSTALLLPPSTKFEFSNFSTNTVAMTMSGTPGRSLADDSVTPGNYKSNGHSTSLVSQCRIIELPRLGDLAGSLTPVVNGQGQLPFDTRRVYYLYDIPADAERGGHSHYCEQRLIVAAAGCFDVAVSDGKSWRTYTLNRPYRGLYVPQGLWRVLNNFSSGSVALALCSTPYSEDDYVRSFNEFLALSAKKIDI